MTRDTRDLIISTQNVEMSKFIDDTIDMIKRTDYHELINYVNKIISFLDHSDFNKLRVKEELVALTERITEMGANIDAIFKTEKFDPQAETLVCISNPIFKDIDGQIKVIPNLNNEIIMINFNKRYFFSIIRGLIDNVEKIARKTNIDDYQIAFRFTQVRGIDGYSEVVYLHAEDNVGEFENMLKIIGHINNNAFEAIKHDGERGTGLATIKKITSETLPWKVEIIDELRNIKELTIPLYTG